MRLAAAAGAMASLFLSFSAGASDAAVVTLDQTLDVNSASSAVTGFYLFDSASFDPFSVDLAEGDTLIWKISFLPGQSLTLSNLGPTSYFSWLQAILYPTTYTGTMTTTITSGNGFNSELLTLFDSTGAEIGWVPGDGGLAHELVGLFNVDDYGLFRPAEDFSSLEVRMRLSNIVTPGITTLNFSSATLALFVGTLLPGQEAPPITRQLPATKPLATITETPPTPPVTAVPEPNVWAMLIVGFGLVGAALRQRRGRLSPA
jgi:hypothetical protein